MALRTDHTWEKSSTQQTKWGPNPGRQRLWMLYELGAWCPQSWALSWELHGENPDCPSELVIMTHTLDGFECPSSRDYVDTKSWLAYEQNPYSTHWVRLGSYHRETFISYDILPAISRLKANMNIQLLHDATTPWCSDLGGCTTLPHPVQPWVAVLLLAWLISNVASMTQHLHHAVAKWPQQRHSQHDLAAPSPAWLDIYIVSRACRPGRVVASMTWQHRHQHDSTSTSCHSHVTPAASSLAWLSSTITSKTRHLDHAAAKSPR
jgi:hypothetical protein